MPLPRASLPDLAEEAKLKTLLRSLGVLDEWLEDNEGHSEDARCAFGASSAGEKRPWSSSDWS